jgi:hypothetical protein
MKLRTELDGSLNLKDDDYVTIKTAKNDSEKVELLVEAMTGVMNEIEIIKLKQEDL